jgi:5'-nucleotidase (lipoprotein e(P4) family)
MTVVAAARFVTRSPVRALAVALIALLSGCGNQQAIPGQHESLNVTLWADTAAEYAASTSQAYHAAEASLEMALADPQWTAALEQDADYSGLPTAVLMDIDQTVLDNSRYNARIVTRYGEYTQDTFSEWCREVAATAIPGAKQFVDRAVERGVTIIYYSRRLETLRDCTTKNLQALGFPLPDQKHLLLNDKLPSTQKTQLRHQLSSQYRILLLVGDDLEDFVAGSKADPAARRTLARQHSSRWGRQWIILPNPMYGSWDTSLYGFDYTLPADQRLNLKLQHLKE